VFLQLDLLGDRCNRSCVPARKLSRHGDVLAGGHRACRFPVSAARATNGRALPLRYPM